MRLVEHLAPSHVRTLESTGKDEVLRELVEAITSAPQVRDGGRLLEAIYERERILSTGIGLGIAVPHAKLEEMDDFVVAVGVSAEGVDFDALDQQPAHVIVLIAAPVGRQRDYLGLLAQVTVTLKDVDMRKRILEVGDDPRAIYRLLVDE